MLNMPTILTIRETGRQKRLKIAFIKPGVSRPGEDNKSVGDIFYDCIEHCWSCKANPLCAKGV